VKATYKKIKACTYAFPEHVTISDNARNLISKILVLDPSKRPNLEEILADPFMGDAIPRTMPRSTLACPPAKNFTDQYLKPAQPSQQQLSNKPSSAAFEKAPKKEIEKEPAMLKSGKEVGKESNFGSTGTGFRASSKDIKLNPKAGLADPSSSKKAGIS
jgi:polo-like kinase 1